MPTDHFDAWLADWRQRATADGAGERECLERMRRSNPAIVLRNELAQALCMNVESVYRVIKALRDNKLIYVASWHKPALGTHWLGDMLAAYGRLAREPAFLLYAAILALSTATFYAFLAGAPLVTRSLGVAKALEHCLEGTPMAPAEALALGMINRVVPADALAHEAMVLAQRMAMRSPFAVRAIKQAVYQAASQSWDQGMAVEKNAFLASASQANTRRAMQVYIPKIREILASGRALTLDDFQEMINGTAADMTSSS